MAMIAWLHHRRTTVLVLAAPFLVASFIWYFNLPRNVAHRPATATLAIPAKAFPAPVPTPKPSSVHAGTAANPRPPESRSDVKGISAEKQQEVGEAVRRLELSRAQHVGTWEIGGVSQMMLLLKTPTRAEMDQLASQIVDSAAKGLDDVEKEMIRVEATDQIHAFLECPFPLKLITFSAPLNEGDPMQFALTFLADEADLTLDPNGGPPSFRVAGGAAGDLTDSLMGRYAHLFNLQ